VKRGRGAEVIVFSPSSSAQHRRRAKKGQHEGKVYPPFLSKTFTMAFAALDMNAVR
jgi:hypothetical protein